MAFRIYVSVLRADGSFTEQEKLIARLRAADQERNDQYTVRQPLSYERLGFN